MGPKNVVIIYVLAAIDRDGFPQLVDGVLLEFQSNFN